MTALLDSEYGGVQMHLPGGQTSAFFASGGDISFYEDGGTVPRMVWDASAEALLLGSLNSLRTTSVAGMNNAQLAIESVSYNPAYIIDNQNNATSPGMLVLGTSRGTGGVATAGGVAISQAGDAVGSIRFAASDGTDLRSNIAEVAAWVSPGTTPGENAVSGELRFSTTSQGQNASAKMVIDATGNVLFGNGNSHSPKIQGTTNSGRTEGSPGYSFNDDLDTGMFQPLSANTVAFSTGGTERLRIDSSGTVKISHADTASEGLRVIQTTAARTSGGALGFIL